MREPGVSEQNSSTVVDKHRGWQVIHAALLSFPALCFAALFGGSAVGFPVLGIILLVNEGNVGAFAVLLCLGSIGYPFMFYMFKHFVAFDPDLLAAGIFFRRPEQVVARSEIRYLTCGFVSQRYCGKVIGENGRILMVIAPSFTQRQVVRLAKQLGVPYRI